MAIIVDADVIIRGEKGDFDFKTWLESRPDDLFEIAAITVAELWHGVERAHPDRRARRLRYLQGVLAPLPIVPYTEQTAYVHASLWASLESAGKTIGAHDLVVAATALERGSEVATFNKRHFEMVPGLRLIEPR
ncbi:MAG: PIN domain-containing protein [Limisphaerales bacterium]